MKMRVSESVSEAVIAYILRTIECLVILRSGKSSKEEGGMAVGLYVLVITQLHVFDHDLTIGNALP